MTINQAAERAQEIVNRHEETTDKEMKDIIFTLSGHIAEGESTLELHIELENVLEEYFDNMEDEYHERIKEMQEEFINEAFEKAEGIVYGFEEADVAEMKRLIHLLSDSSAANDESDEVMLRFILANICGIDEVDLDESCLFRSPLIHPVSDNCCGGGADLDEDIFFDLPDDENFFDCEPDLDFD